MSLSEINERQLASSLPEDIFVELFAQVFGLERVQFLAYEYPFEDIEGNSRSIDYALRTPDERVAFEIDGLQWHHPAALSVEGFEDGLLRQNSLIHLGWRVFRWTDRQLAEEPERVKDQLALFLENVPGLLSFDEFLPKQQGALFELRPHQQEALDALESMRTEGKTIALLTHAQGAGKTVVAVTDAKRLNGRTLFLAHRRELVLQAYNKFAELWPEASRGLHLGDVRDTEPYNIAGSIQSVSQHLDAFPHDTFDYLVIDEAHHAAARTYRSVLGYFIPRFVLGLTATPDRADGQSTLELFRECAHRLSLSEAVALGELVPIRCVRVETNVDIQRVRVNGIQYNRKDVEQALIVPARDKLIVDTYLEHVPGRKAVAFCVNVRHGESLAELFRMQGVPARAVSGRMPRAERQRCLDEFHAGDLRVLCACDILNEGWDCPDIEVLLMARPTLSKVIYLQQLGRGTRKAPGKECLVVFDFVDNATRYNCAWTLHRVVGRKHYRPGGLVLAPEGMLAAEEGALARGEKPTMVLNIHLWARDFQEIDLFNWQEAVADMVPVAEVEAQVAASEGAVRRAIERGQLKPDHTLVLGERVYHYFHRDRLQTIRELLGIPDISKENVKELFLDYATRMDMTTSYKPVFVRALLDSIDAKGRARLSDVVAAFRKFYQDRESGGLVVDSPSARLARIKDLEDAEIQQIVLRMPFEKFERRRYLEYERDVAYIRFARMLWSQLDRDDLARLRTVCDESIAAYYARLEP